MTLPAPNLDDLRFQSDLVDEARKRIIHYCPEWTEYNLSDPGITLIELFSWMTEMMLYRLNRVPERNYIKFLDMLGFQLTPARSAEADITFWLSALLPLAPDDETEVIVPSGTEVQSDDQNDPVVFTTAKELVIVPPILCHLRTEDNFSSNLLSRLGMEIFYPFNKTKPRTGDTFYIGFDDKNNLSGHVLRLEFTCEPTEAVGIRREDPPWVWECLTSEGWEEVKPSTYENEKDTTGGLNNENGALTLYLPLSFSSQVLHGLQGFWVRCRIEQRDSKQGMFTESPRVTGLEVYAVGAQVPAINAQLTENEMIGESSGEPGQHFTVLNSPILTLGEDEHVEVEELVNGEAMFVPWQEVDDFANSTKFDRHFVLETASGTIQFGPSVRQSDGTVLQYGKIPENGFRIQMNRYRYGGGVKGNLPEHKINVMNTSLAYISRADNLFRATGGRDQEKLEELIYRAQRELQAQRRAVTAEDFEQFTLKSSRSVARVCCLPPEQAGNQEVAGGIVNILVVPDAHEALEDGNLKALHLTDDLKTKIRKYLDQYRLLTATLNIDEPTYFGIKVNVKIVPYEFAKEADVITEVDTALRRFLSPLDQVGDNPMPDTEGKGKGWPFGRSVFVAEIISLIQKIPTVKYVLETDVSWRRVVPINEDPENQTKQKEELQSVDKMLLLPKNGLVCSLLHEIQLTTLEDFAKKGNSAS